MSFTIRTTKGNTYYLDDGGAVVARSNGPQGWDYSGKWVILGFGKRYHSRSLVSLQEAVSGEDIGHGIIHDLDHGTHRVWHGERLGSITKEATA